MPSEKNLKNSETLPVSDIKVNDSEDDDLNMLNGMLG